MATVQNPIIGRASGTMANAVFSTWKGINVLKSKPLSNNSNTEAQQTQRSLFKTVVSMLKYFSQAARVGFYERAQGTSYTPWNLFVKSNTAAFTWDEAIGTVVLDATKFTVSDPAGNVLDTTGGTATGDYTNITLNFPANANANYHILMLNQNSYTPEGVVVHEGQLDATGQAVIPRNWDDSDEYDVFYFLDDGVNVSRSAGFLIS
ncbi:DUF6266 family protein [Limibacter armeniacum]|uniref:DUF6266 family protein n=1 Tax=Limibacter armeniacum TaxID=466084 RepID=UPI002FE523B9